MPLTPQSIIENSELIIIKIGSVLIRGQGIEDINQSWLNALAQDVQSLKKQGKRVVIVSSGGVALGRKALGIPANIPPSSIPLAKKQAASSVGQYHMFNGYFKAFEKIGITAAQVLLTMGETENRRMNLNARETLTTLLDNDIIPIINENDTVSTGEIRFGDNDRLAVRVAQMIMADSVVLLSTADGLYTDNPDKNDNAVHIPLVEAITQEHVKMAGDAVAGLSTGGMKSKIEAAISANKAGIHLMMCDGRLKHSLANLCEENNDKKSTLFVAQKSDANARKIWIQSHMSPKGVIMLDDGAVTALKSGRSLLPIGVISVSGDFRRGDPVIIKDQHGIKLGMGLAAYNANDALKIIGKASDKIADILGYIGRDELIHRNDMVLEN
ncbi:MAG: glutamate 5-kinase [Alphaproteobacteria bacterium]